MAVHGEGWKLLWRGKAGSEIAYVRFRHEGHRYDLTTRQRDSGKARKEAAKIYADVVSGRWARDRLATSGGSDLPLTDLTSRWLADFEAGHPTGTPAIFELYANLWEERMGATLGSITTASVERYTLDRLGEVMRATVSKERSALRVFLGWCVGKGYLTTENVPHVPPLAKHLMGTKATNRKEKATAIDETQALAFCAALPEKSTRSERGKHEELFPVRARFIVAWETGLRPATLDRLTVPRHYAKGQDHLAITDDIDKARYGRDVGLSKRARSALDAVCPDEGPIFGKHDYRKHVKAAVALAKLPASFSPYDLRHGRATHLLALGASLSGVGFVLGHKQATTTNRYLRMSKREGDRAIELSEPVGEVLGEVEIRSEESGDANVGK